MSKRLPVLGWRDVVKALKSLGYEHDRTSGSHMIYVKADVNSITVPRHNELKRGTLKSIIKATGETVESFLSHCS